MDFSQMKEQLRQSLQPKRFEHSVAVSETAVALARHYGSTKIKPPLPACSTTVPASIRPRILWRYQKSWASRSRISKRRSPSLSMPSWGPFVAKRDYGVTDEEVLSAMRYHTTGKAHMTALEKSFIWQTLRNRIVTFLPWTKCGALR